jgi:hypothetical protein
VAKINCINVSGIYSDIDDRVMYLTQSYHIEELSMDSDEMSELLVLDEDVLGTIDQGGDEMNYDLDLPDEKDSKEACLADMDAVMQAVLLLIS